MVRGKHLQLRELHAWLHSNGKESSRQKAVGLAVAVILHIGSLSAILLAGPGEPPVSSARVIDVALFTSELPEPQPPIAADPELEPEPPQTIDEETIAPPSISEPATGSENQAGPSEQEPVSAQSTTGDASLSEDPGTDAYPLNPGTRSVLSGIQCPGDIQTFQRTGVCPDGARRTARLTAAGESPSDHYSIDVSAIRAMFGVSPHALAGTATLASGLNDPSFSNSDAMRDRLPSSAPDPAFGD
ncbi:hypothetical protein [Hyphobacterium sp.]|uniref:hypothetical protein n=1 Tax=Hyphobacterium sp. TaxID=2004662 RepID=UPI003BAA3694